MDYKAPARHHDELGQTIYMVKANTFLSCDEPSQHKYRKSETRKEDAKHQIENPSREPDSCVRQGFIQIIMELGESLPFRLL